MASYQKCPAGVELLRDEILKKFDTHAPLVKHKVKIDLLFAWPEYDEKTGEPISDALKHHGVKALGLCRKLGLKDRTKGMGDAEIVLDGEYWTKGASPEEQEALLDHEMHHICVKYHPNTGTLLTDELGRPRLSLRDHDVQVGFFAIIAKRHGMASQECIQSKAMMDQFGQFFWPTLDHGHQMQGRMQKLEHRTNAS